MQGKSKELNDESGNIVTPKNVSLTGMQEDIKRKREKLQTTWTST